MSGKVWKIWWGLLRLPAALVIVFLLRDPIVDVIERVFDIVGMTLFAIDVLSTPATRAILACGLVAGFAVCAWWITARYPHRLYPLLLGIALVVFGLLFAATRSSWYAGAFAFLLFATNTLPDSMFQRTNATGRKLDRFVAFAVGIAEIFLFRRYIIWLASLFDATRLRAWLTSGHPSALLPALVIPCAVAALLISAPRLVPSERWLRAGSHSERVVKGNFNWIQGDVTGRYLYVTGHGVARLRRYDLHAPGWSYIESNVDTGYAQAFAYDPEAAELYVYNSFIHDVIVLDANSLERKRTMRVENLAPGDPWIVVDGHTDTMAIASEADVSSGRPFVVMKRSTGETLDVSDEEFGNVLLDPHTSRLYLSYFRRASGVKAYDLRKLRFEAVAPSDERVDRMALHGEELLVASPMQSRIARYDADTLQPLGEMKVGLGVRVLAIDDVRKLILCGSLVTGKVTVLDAATGSERASYYLGPWLRTISLDARAGVAYVSANGSLYRLGYGSDL